MCTHVDDFCFGGAEKFLEEGIGGLKEKLIIGEEELSKFRYIGVNVQRDEEGVWMEHDRYIDSISAPIEGDFNDDRELKGNELTLYRSLVDQLNWVSQHTRPNMAFQMSALSKNFQKCASKDMRKLRKIVNVCKKERIGVRLS